MKKGLQSLPLLALAALVGFSSCSKRLTTDASKVGMSRMDSVAYAFGVLNSEAFASVVGKIPGDSLSRAAIMQGFEAGFLGKETKISSADAKRLFESYALEAQAAEIKRRTAQTDSLLQANKSKPGVQVTESGLQWRVLRATQGEHPTVQDTVVVNYTGRLLDGTEFDSSYKRGEPAVFPLSQVIAGWTEGICLMTPGAKYEFLIPANLAYGDRGVGGVIPPGAPLLFEVELLSVRHPQGAAEAAANASGVKAGQVTKEVTKVPPTKKVTRRAKRK